MAIPKSLYSLVQQRAKFRCEYCHYPEILSSAPLSIDHLQPQSLGGTDDPENLALAYRRCNERRYNFVTGTDPDTGIESTLFNPRQHIWADHFSWSFDATRIIGKLIVIYFFQADPLTARVSSPILCNLNADQLTTAIGRATCDRLDLNDNRRNDRFIQSARQKWLISGFHPSAENPRQENP